MLEQCEIQDGFQLDLMSQGRGWDVQLRGRLDYSVVYALLMWGWGGMVSTFIIVT